MFKVGGRTETPWSHKESALMHELERADLSYEKRKAVADIIFHAKTSGKRKKKSIVLQQTLL